MGIRYIKAKELSGRWGVTPRRINQLCAAGKIPGAYKEGNHRRVTLKEGFFRVLLV